MSKKKYQRENLYKIIAVYTGPDGHPAFAKFRNIEADKPPSWKRTEQFLKTRFPTIHHVNVYGGITGEFKRRIKFDQ